MKYVVLAWVGVALVSCSPHPDANVPSRVVTETKKTGPVDKPAPAQQQKPTVKPGEVTAVDMGQLFTMLQSDKVHLVDVRPPIFYRLGHIDGAVNFPLKKYDASLPKNLPLIEQAIASGKVVVLYCQNLKCPDAFKTSQKLIKLGHSVSIYKGGWEEWKKSGLQ